MEYRPFPKVPRWNRDILVTEKIDGTNGCVSIDPDHSGDHVLASSDGYAVRAGSRTRWITPAADNFGFAAWVQRNADALVRLLGPGNHFGEWWGKGIQRGYGLDRRYFSLFNVTGWPVGYGDEDVGLRVVPILACGPVGSGIVDYAVSALRTGGSRAAPGYANPEGVIVFHTAGRHPYKVLLENDAGHKGAE